MEPSTLLFLLVLGVGVCTLLIAALTLIRRLLLLPPRVDDPHRAHHHSAVLAGLGVTMIVASLTLAPGSSFLSAIVPALSPSPQPSAPPTPAPATPSSVLE